MLFAYDASESRLPLFCTFLTVNSGEACFPFLPSLMGDMMINEIFEFSDKIEKLLTALRIKFMFEIMAIVLIGMVVFKLIDLFDSKLKAKLTLSNNSPLTRFVPILSNIFKGVVVFFLLASFLQSHGYSMSSLIAGFGITGLAVGFAAQKTIANIFGTFGILSDHSYQLGDYINVNGFEGNVEEINMRSTKIRALDNSLIILPNDVVSGAIIKNVTNGKKRRIFETFGVTYDTSDEKLQRAITILEEILANNKDIHDGYIVYLETLSSSSIDIKVSAYTKTNVYNKFLKIKEQVILEAVKKFREEGIEFAFPSTTVYMAKDEN
jgi:mechanosensitive ion channel, mscS family